MRIKELLVSTNTLICFSLCIIAIFIWPTRSVQIWTCDDLQHDGHETSVGNCSRYGDFAVLRCFGDIHSAQFFDEQVTDAAEVVLCGWPKKTFDALVDLQIFPKIRKLTIERSNMSEISNDFPKMSIQSINITWTKLAYMGSHTFEQLYALKELDLRWNQLIQLEHLILPDLFERLYLGGNPWNCTYDLHWMEVLERKNCLMDKVNLICTDRKYKDRNMLIVMTYEMRILRECQSHPELMNCTCAMHHIIPKTQTPLYTVNCSNLHLSRLPSYIPQNTSTFFANDNQIKDVLPLRNNPFYDNVVDIYLDNNEIESIDVLEGGSFLLHFRLLSLRGNKLKKFPTYALDNAIEENPTANLLLLSRNPWFCTCKFAMRFNKFLLKYNSIVRDASNISCYYTQGEITKTAKLLTITRQDVCKPLEFTKFYPLDILNAVLAVLIFLILIKLAYDYYQYRYHGRVHIPWVVMKVL